jgi:hypothetical protein
LSKQDTTYSELRVSKFENVSLFFKYWREAFLAICIFGSFLFLLNNLIASFFYSGGSNINPSNPGYSFVWNYVSDLGRAISISGKLNLISRTIFTVTLTIVGLAAASFSITFSNFFKKTTLSKYGAAILIFGVLNGIDYIVIGFLPIDTHFNEHNICVIIAFALKIILLGLLIVIILKDENYPNKYAYIFISYLTIFLTFSFLLVLSVYDILIPYLITSILGQKLTFYLEAVLYIIQSIGALIYYKRNAHTINAR